jgi:hypothetical protein
MTKNPLFRLLLINGLAGAGLGIAFVIGILALDVAGIRTLLVQTGDWLVGVPMLLIGCITTFASVTMGSAIMMTRRDEDRDPPQRGLGAPAYVRVQRAVRRHPERH